MRIGQIERVGERDIPMPTPGSAVAPVMSALIAGVVKWQRRANAIDHFVMAITSFEVGFGMLLL